MLGFTRKLASNFNEVSTFGILTLKVLLCWKLIKNLHLIKNLKFKNCKLVSRHLVIDFYAMLTSLIPGCLANEQKIFCEDWSLPLSGMVDNLRKATYVWTLGMNTLINSFLVTVSHQVDNLRKATIMVIKLT